MQSFFGSVFSWISGSVSDSFETVSDSSISSSRYVTRPIVNNVVNKLAFLPPERSHGELVRLEQSRNHFIAVDNEYSISYIVCNPSKSYIHKKYKNKACILFSHGNGSDNLDMQGFCHQRALVFGLDCICYDYLGYGLSGYEYLGMGFDLSKHDEVKKTKKMNYPSEEGCYKSLQIMMNELSKKYTKIFFGRSIFRYRCMC